MCTDSFYIFFIPLCRGTCLSAYRKVGIVRNSFMIIYNYHISYLYSIVVIWISLVSHIYHNFMYFYIALMIWIIFPCLSLLPNIYITVIYAFLRDTYLWVVACTLVLYPNTLVVPVSSAYFSSLPSAYILGNLHQNAYVMGDVWACVFILFIFSKSTRVLFVDVSVHLLKRYFHLLTPV